jgi:D-alanyl-D-alanine carboxypeptidase (penicillin-binding protein 5/6)
MWRRWGAVLCFAAALCSPAAARPLAVVSRRTPATLLVDANSGEALREDDADLPRPAGSLNQLMVLLLSLEEASLGGLPLDVPVIVSSNAAMDPAHTGAAKAPAMGMAAASILHADREYLLSDLLKAVVIGSANDATVAVAEAVGGSVAACLELMNARAQKLGMQATQYFSIGGVHPLATAAPDITSARDLARLAALLIRHPLVLQWASLSGFPFDQGTTLLHNANQLLGKVPGVDGVQGSATRADRAHPASYSIVATAQRGALRLIAVVLDAPDSAERYKAAAEMLEWGFANYERLEIAKKGEPLNLPIRVVNGTVAQLTPVAGETYSLLRRREEERNLVVRYQLPEFVSAPLRRQQQIGEIVVQERDELIAVVPLMSPAEIASASVLSAALP